MKRSRTQRRSRTLKEWDTSVPAVDRFLYMSFALYEQKCRWIQQSWLRLQSCAVMPQQRYHSFLCKMLEEGVKHVYS